ncbi:class E sortase [Glycomyces paridis]|uniref:Class E sortase n=1 Tax=Glycomyces paridis TaxID=2126555 RepID=A0A4S8PC20_9ACTN|nr:class E sortase [Glycomyces paridis]THV27065.1 class E sortase [Glycomyces paridis]
MSDQDWSPFANEPRPRPPQGPPPGPGRAGVPPPGRPPGPAPSGQAKVPPPDPGAAGRATPPSPPRPTSPPRASPPEPGAAGRATPPPPPEPAGPRPAAPPPSGPDFDETTALRPPGLNRAARAPLVPEPDGTAILPVIPADDAVPAPPGADSEARKKRSVKRHRGDGGGMRGTVRGLGEALITLGAVVLLYAGYEVFGVSAEINNEQQTLSTDLDSIWDGEVEGETVDGAPIPELGDAFARMWAPDIRAEAWTLVEGTEPSDIEYAPGRFLDGAYPGEQGNFTLAGHNVPAIFSEIRSLEAGDKVVIETKEFFYVYEVQEHEVVNETEVTITEPVPHQPGVEPGDEDYWLTLFTCHPRWDNYERYVVYSQLVDTIERDPEGDLPPAAIDPEV